MRETDSFEQIPARVWEQDWVVHCHAFKYLAPYVFRVAISNSRILTVENDEVTFRYRASDTGQSKLCTLDAEEFIRRPLRVQHVLPKGFVKVRYAARGFLSPGCRPQLALIRQQLSPAVLEPVASTEPDPCEELPIAPVEAQPESLPSAHTSTAQVSDSETASPDPPAPAAEPDTASPTSQSIADTPTPHQSILTELDDEPDLPDEPA